MPAHPLDNKGNPTTLGSQSKAYLFDVSLGQSKNKNDVQFGYAFERQEQDSILASFAESDQTEGGTRFFQIIHFLV